MCTDRIYMNTCTYVYRQNIHEQLYLCVLTEYTWTPVFMCTNRIYMNSCTYVYWQNIQEHLYSSVETEYTWTPVLMCTDGILMNTCTYVYRQNMHAHLYLCAQTDYIWTSALCTDKLPECWQYLPENLHSVYQIRLHTKVFHFHPQGVYPILQHGIQRNKP